MKKIICLFISAITVLVLFAGLTASAEDTVDVSENHYDELPVRFDPSIDCFELEDLFDEDGSGYNRNTNGPYDYYFLKGEYGKTYMKIKFNVEEAGTYEFCIGLMAIGSSVPRSGEWQINGGQRYYVSRMYTGMDSANGVAEYIDGITGYLRAGENTITFYSGYDFDNVNVKSVFIDKVFYARTGDLPAGYKFPGEEDEQEEVDITGAVPEIVKFNANFKSIVTGSIFCSYDFVDDAEKGNVLKLTVTESVDVPRFSFSYNKYMKLLGLDPDTDTCNKYNYLVLCIKADAGIASGTADMFAFTDGQTLISEEKRYQEYFDTESGWQYIIYDMEGESYWAGKYDGGYFLVGGSGCEVGSAMYVSELALFETLEDAERYTGQTPSSETTVKEETVISSETEGEQKTAAETAAETEAATTVADGAAATEKPGDTKKSGCCGTLAVLAVLALFPIAVVTVKKKDN